MTRPIQQQKTERQGQPVSRLYAPTSAVSNYDDGDDDAESSSGGGGDDDDAESSSGDDDADGSSGGGGGGGGGNDGTVLVNSVPNNIILYIIRFPLFFQMIILTMHR